MPIRLPRTADYFLTVAAFEVAALQRYLDLMERNLEQLLIQDPRPLLEDYQGRLAEGHVAQLHHEVINTMLPQLFRSSYALVLYGAYEAALTEAAEVLRIQHAKDAKLPTRDNFLREAKKYFSEQFRIDLLEPSEPTTRTIYSLSRVRSALVHANGRKGAMAPKKWDALERDRAAGAAIALEDNYLTLKPQFLVDALHAVRISIRGLQKAARTSLEDASHGPNADIRPRLRLGGLD
jgi:hypothetical protein